MLTKSKAGDKSHKGYSKAMPSGKAKKKSRISKAMRDALMGQMSH